MMIEQPNDQVGIVYLKGEDFSILYGVVVDLKSGVEKLLMGTYRDMVHW